VSKCTRCNCDECVEYGAVLYEGQRLLFCDDAPVSCLDLFIKEGLMDYTHMYQFPEDGSVFEMQPVPLAVPTALTHIVCTCSENTQMNLEPSVRYPRKDKKVELLRLPDNIHAPVCRNCFKYFRWVMRTCVLCKNPFTATFRHPNYCKIRPACWDCLEEQDEPMCKGALDGDSHSKCTVGRHSPKWIKEIDKTRYVVKLIDFDSLPDLDFGDF